MIPFRATEPRPDEQVVGGFIPVVMGGEARTLPVLTIAENRAWTAKFAGSIRAKLDAVGPLQSVDEVVTLLMESMDTMLDLLVAYDRDGVLGDKQWMDTHATDREVYETLKRVTAAAFPFGVDLRTLIPELMPMLMSSLSKGVAMAGVTLASSRPTNGSATSTDAPRRRRSKRPSPTSS